jgi:uncharacterized membrane-anchored protein
MRENHLPSLDNRYWVAVLGASLLGTTLGDFVSHDLGLGFVRGLVPLGALLAVILFAERRATAPNEGYYWAAIVITRTAATNLADLATHSLRFDYRGVAACLAVLLVITLLAGRRRGPRPVVSREPGCPQIKTLPATDSRYWAAITIVSTLGTTLGDFVSDGLALGVGKGSMLLA